MGSTSSIMTKGRSWTGGRTKSTSVCSRFRTFVSGDFEVGKLFRRTRLPPSQFLMPAVQAQAQREAHWTTDRQAGDRIVSHRAGAVTVVIVAVYIVKKAPDVFTEGIINDHRRLTAALAMRCRLLEHEPAAAAIDFVLPPGTSA